MMKFLWNYSDTILPLATMMVFLFLRRPLINKNKLLVAYLVVTAGIMWYSNYLADRVINNMYLYHLYSLLEVFLLVPMIAGFSKTKSKTIIACVGSYVLFWLIDVWLLEPVTAFNSNSASIAALLVTVFCFRFFLYLIQSDEVLYFQRRPSFWITSGIFFYCVATILITGSYKYKEWFSGDINTHVVWRILQITNIIKFVLISIGVVCCYRSRSTHGL